MIEHIRVVPEKCRACRRCEVACIAAHHNMTFKDAMKHRDTYVPRVQVIKADGLKTTVRCHQCQPAPCCNVCPTAALRQDDEGRITFHEEHCIACEMCIRACPYGTISLDAPNHACEAIEGAVPEPLDSPHPCREVAVRCDMCYEWRKENGKEVTACMEVCPVQALYMVKPDGSKVEMPKPEKKADKKADKSAAGNAGGQEGPVPVAKEQTPEKSPA